MKKWIIFSFICMVFFIITFFIVTSPEGVVGESSSEILKKSMDNDVFLYDRHIYFADANYKWEENPLELRKGHKIGEIETTTTRVLLFRLFQDFTATSLKKGTEIYATNKNSTHYLIAHQDGEKLLYIKMVEG